MLEQVHDAPVGHRSDSDVGYFLQRRLVVERRVEQAARLGQHFQPSIRGRRLFAGDLLAHPVEALLLSQASLGDVADDRQHVGVLVSAARERTEGQLDAHLRALFAARKEARACPDWIRLPGRSPIARCPGGRGPGRRTVAR